MGRGQQEGGDREVGKREGEKKGHEEGGFHRWKKCLGGHMECLGGTRLRSFLTLFTSATPRTPASYLLGKGGYVFGSVDLSVCLFVCEQHYSKSYERIGMKFCGRVLSSTNKN